MEGRKKRHIIIATILTLLVAISLFAGCKPADTQIDNEPTVEDSKATQITETPEDAEEKNSDDMNLTSEVNRNFLIKDLGDSLPEYVPSVADYQVSADLSGIDNMDQVYLQDQMKEKLAKNLFVVTEPYGNEFFDVYEVNRYCQRPNFITVDSMMHTYHLYFAMLQKNIEQEYLIEAVKQMSLDMQKSAVDQFEELRGSEWEDAAKTNMAFFSVAATLVGEDVQIPNEVKEIVTQELKLIQEANAVTLSPMDNRDEDYSQYKPRGYYEGDEALESYFRTMMWYGRRNFAQKNETMDRCALLMTLALQQTSMENWEKIYSVTSFFAGASDDSGVYEYLPLIQQAYGEKITMAALIENEQAFDVYHKLTGELDPPQINSVVFQDDEGKTDKTEEAKGYRFMGQRFTLDAAVFTQLCYSKVKENPQGDKRMLPDSLDIPAAMGSDMALELLKENGNFEYQGYPENMEQVKAQISNAPDTLWQASLYGEWLYTLSPLLKQKEKGYPSFMQSNEWTKKNLEAYLSSFTELKHDTILYSKQFMAEMGGGDEVIDDRGYVEPEPEVFARLSALTQNMADGLKSYDMIRSADQENLERLSQLSDRLKEISLKELTGEEITEDDYELIRSYGGSIEHFWTEAVKDYSKDEAPDSSMVPAALVVDVATDPNGSVLEQAIGGISDIYVIVPVDGGLRVAKGAVFSYYQFIQPLEERMTDSEWRRKIGLELNDEMDYEPDENIKQPEWTDSYRSSWNYDE